MCTLVHSGTVILPANVTVVYTKSVVKLASVTVAVALGSTNVPLGSPALSVSILSFKSTQGDTNFFNASFNVLAATPLHRAGILTLVFAVTSPMFWTWSASANVTISSTNKLSPATTSSHSR